MHSSHSLRIGVAVDGNAVPAWIAALLHRVETSGVARIECLTVHPPTAHRVPLSTALYQHLDRTLFGVKDDAQQPIELASALPRLTSLPSQAPVDVWLHLSVQPLPPGDAPLGTWYFLPDLLDGSVGLSAVGTHQLLASAALFARYGNTDYCIYRASTGTHAFSARRSGQRLCWLAHAFVARRLQALHECGPDVFYARHGTPATAPLTTRPTAFPLTRFAARTFHRGLSELLQRTQWHVYYGPTTAGNLPASFDDFAPCASAPNTYWADPFPFRHEGSLYVFVEEYDQQLGKGHIAVQPFDQRGPCGNAVRVLEANHHLSYPFVFAHEGEIYLMPESSDRGTIDIYRCLRFPDQWTHSCTLFEGLYAVDSTLFYREGHWWLFTCLAPHPQSPARSELFLYYADSPLAARWTPHPLNPVVSDVRWARPAGRIAEVAGRLLRPAQDCSRRYGYGLRLMEIVEWDTQRYAEREYKQYLPQGKRLGMHTFNRDMDWTFVDIKSRARRWLG